MTTTVTLGGRIREARGGLTQYELADRVRSKLPGMKVTEARISRYERDVQVPRLAVLVAIAEVTDQSLDFFKVGSDDGQQPSPDPDDEEARTLLRAAYEFDKQGNYALADDLRRAQRRHDLARKKVGA